MDFILGIFTGISITILWGHYLNEKRKKQRGVPKHRNPPEPPPKFGNLQQRTEDYKRRIMAAYGINPELLSTLENSTFYVGFRDDDLKYINELSLSIRLKAAIEREDFEEAARLRDLINRK